MVGSKIIDRALSLITKGELEKPTTTLRQAHFGAVMSGSLQLSCTNSSKTGVQDEVSHSSPESDPVEVQKFHHDDIRGPVHTTQKVTILLFSTVSVHANTSVKGHSMWVHLLMELTLGPQLPAAVVVKATYRELHPGSWRIPICLCNMSTHTVQIPTKAMVWKVVPTNQVPPVVHPTRTSEETHNKSHMGWVLEALDLQGLHE